MGPDDFSMAGDAGGGLGGGLGSAIGAGSGIAGEVANLVAGALTKQKLYNLFKAQLAQQLGFEHEGFNAFKGALPGYGAGQAGKDIASGAQNRMNLANYSMANPMFVGSAPVSGQTKAALGLDNAASARVGGYNDWGTQQGIRQQNLGDILRRINFASQGASSVYPIQQQQTEHQYDWVKAVGQIVQSLGGAASAIL